MNETKPLRAAVVGLGMGKQHIKAYGAAAGVEVVALCDPDTDRLAAARDEFGIDTTFTDADELFASGAADLASIATPNRFHAPLTIAAFDAGLHVLCEKPMAMNANEAQQMVDAAQNAGRKLGIHFNHRMNPATQWIGRFAHAGDLGEVYFARTFWHRRRGIPARASFLNMANSGGGGMIDLGVHMLDQALFVMGYPDVASVTAQTFTKFDRKDVPDITMDVDDFAIALIRLANGAVLELEISWASHHDHPEELGFQVYGTEGGARRLTQNYKEVQTTVHRREHGGLNVTRMDQPPRDLISVQQDFVNAIREDREPACAARHGLITMKVLDALYESSRLGREVILESTG